jgi:hypothetical protein
MKCEYLYILRRFLYSLCSRFAFIHRPIERTRNVAFYLFSEPVFLGENGVMIGMMAISAGNERVLSSGT